MLYNHAKVDLSLIPDSTVKDTFIHLAEQHNALVDGANEMKQDLDQISGITPEEKQDLYKAMGIFRKIGNYLHGKRFSVTMLLFQGYVSIGILRQFGLNPDQAHRLVEALIRLIEKVS